MAGLRPLKDPALVRYERDIILALWMHCTAREIASYLHIKESLVWLHWRRIPKHMKFIYIAGEGRVPMRKYGGIHYIRKSHA